MIASAVLLDRVVTTRAVLHQCPLLGHPGVEEPVAFVEQLTIAVRFRMVDLRALGTEHRQAVRALATVVAGLGHETGLRAFGTGTPSHVLTIKDCEHGEAQVLVEDVRWDEVLDVRVERCGRAAGLGAGDAVQLGVGDEREQMGR